MPVIFLKSLNPPRLMNGTRCIVTKAMRNLIEVKIASGPFKDEKHLIPRIRLQSSKTALSFTFQRQQFALRPCFSLTIKQGTRTVSTCSWAGSKISSLHSRHAICGIIKNWQKE
ncbi:ATP-dependent DNA helicase PIF1 [Elysia marginata]|uniref:ATP-dependent DNA helicase PIF1 n=1 Tax=Elysia marginata TaxID=1093978 RepID=A0AAV4IVA3_9GAST|nr:ATP-dependent DNA helicase PIF1 [Elysia marginata]